MGACGGQPARPEPPHLTYTTPTPAPTAYLPKDLSATEIVATERPTPTVVPIVAPPAASVRAAQVSDPLAGHEAEMRAAEERYQLPAGILGAIATRESSYGVNACGFNAWGIASCRGDNYASWPEGIEAAASLFAHWLAVRGNLQDALCTWVLGGTCTEDGAYDYAASVLALLGPR